MDNVNLNFGDTNMAISQASDEVTFARGGENFTVSVEDLFIAAENGFGLENEAAGSAGQGDIPDLDGNGVVDTGDLGVALTDLVSHLFGASDGSGADVGEIQGLGETVIEVIDFLLEEAGVDPDSVSAQSETGDSMPAPAAGGSDSGPDVAETADDAEREPMIIGHTHESGHAHGIEEPGYSSGGRDDGNFDISSDNLWTSGIGDAAKQINDMTEQMKQLDLSDPEQLADLMTLKLGIENALMGIEALQKTADKFFDKANSNARDIGV